MNKKLAYEQFPTWRDALLTVVGTISVEMYTARASNCVLRPNEQVDEVVVTVHFDEVGELLQRTLYHKDIDKFLEIIRETPNLKIIDYNSKLVTLSTMPCEVVANFNSLTELLAYTARHDDEEEDEPE